MHCSSWINISSDVEYVVIYSIVPYTQTCPFTFTWLLYRQVHRIETPWLFLDFPDFFPTSPNFFGIFQILCYSEIRPFYRNSFWFQFCAQERVLYTKTFSDSKKTQKQLPDYFRLFQISIHHPRHHYQNSVGKLMTLSSLPLFATNIMCCMVSSHLSNPQN